MSFATNQSQQISLFDATVNLTEREKRLLGKSWAKYFAENIFPEVDEAPFSVLYSDRPSRHNTPGECNHWSIDTERNLCAHR